jgi:hypothetical protein
MRRSAETPLRLMNDFAPSEQSRSAAFTPFHHSHGTRIQIFHGLQPRTLKRPEGRAPKDLLPSAAGFWFAGGVPFNPNQSMKNFTKIFALIFALAAFTLAAVGIARAEDNFAGKWQGQFDSQIGLQKYTFEFKVDGTNVTGKAIGEREMGTNEVVLAEGTISSNGIFFVEPLKLGNNELRIEYTGKISGDEIKFHRKVGDVAEEDFTAKRVKAGEGKADAPAEAKPAATTETNSPPAKP